MNVCFGFMILIDQEELKKMIRRSLRLKHHAILKPVLCNDSEELSKLISACTVYTETFVVWKGKQKQNAKDDYLSDAQKDMIM